MKAQGRPILAGDVEIGELDSIEERDGAWVIRWHITDVEAAQRAGIDVLSAMAHGAPALDAATKTDRALGSGG